MSRLQYYWKVFWYSDIVLYLFYPQIDYICLDIYNYKLFRASCST